jgi:two-component system LytT family sensor kinase
VSARYFSVSDIDELRCRHSWLRIAAIWLGVALIDASQTVLRLHAQGLHYPQEELVISLMLSWVPWALVTPLVVALTRRFVLVPRTTLRALAIHLSALMGVSLISAGWSAFLEFTLDPWAQPAAVLSLTNQWVFKFVYGFPASIGIYCSILSVTLVMDSRTRMARQELEASRRNEQLSNAQLEVMRREIEPHIILNTLNAVTGLIRGNRSDDAVSVIVVLSDFLRRVIKPSPPQLVTLEEEVAQLNHYLRIQKARLAERLQARVDIPADLLRARVPNMFLQPLVENAIKHGIVKCADGGAISIVASRSLGKLNLIVYNDGPAVAPDWHRQSTGMGLANLRMRLRSLYGAGFELALWSGNSTGTEVLVSIPFDVA